MNTIELGLGWLRAAAQGHNYSHNKIGFMINANWNLMSWFVKLNWGSDGCASWRLITITIKINLRSNFQMNFKSWGLKQTLRLEAARGCARLQLQPH